MIKVHSRKNLLIELGTLSQDVAGFVSDVHLLLKLDHFHSRIETGLGSTQFLPRKIHFWLDTLPTLLRKVWHVHPRFQLFSAEIFFEEKTFNSVVGVFLLLLALPMTRRIVSRIVGVLLKTSVGCHRGCESRRVGSNPAVDHSFYIISDIH